jgi:hypothetical protein
MSNAYLKTNSLTIIALVLSVSGWITSGFLCYEIHQQKRELSEINLLNAKNIIANEIKSVTKGKAANTLVEHWISDHWSAQTGSLTTICHHHPSMLSEINPVIKESDVKQICRTIDRSTHG